MSRTILVFGQKNFKVEVPDDAKLTFGPWSPPTGENKYAGNVSDRALIGTLRIYKGTEHPHEAQQPKELEAVAK